MSPPFDGGPEFRAFILIPDATQILSIAVYPSRLRKVGMFRRGAESWGGKQFYTERKSIRITVCFSPEGWSPGFPKDNSVPP